MFDLASEENFKKGDIIFKENSAGDWVYVVLSGTVEISKTANEKKFVVAELHEGEVFGELSFLGGIRRTATAIALEDVVLGLQNLIRKPGQATNFQVRLRSGANPRAVAERIERDHPDHA